MMLKKWKPHSELNAFLDEENAQLSSENLKLKLALGEKITTPSLSESNS